MRGWVRHETMRISADMLIRWNEKEVASVENIYFKFILVGSLKEMIY